MTIYQYINSKEELKKFDFVTVYKTILVLLDDKKLNMHDFVNAGIELTDNV